MSNLGWYQIIVSASKKVGGPLRLAGLIAGGGAGLYAGGEAIARHVKKLLNQKQQEVEAAVIYTVRKEGQSHEGLLFMVGKQFKVLEVDGDAALIVFIK